MENNNNRISVGIVHLFATGGDPRHDAIFHIGGVRLSTEQSPVYQDWIINTGKHITKRHFTLSRVAKTIADRSPTWEQCSNGISDFFNGLDVIFVFNLRHEERWFKSHVFPNLERRPMVVDLYEMARFFLPGRMLFDINELIDRAVPKSASRGDTRLPLILRALTRLLNDVVESINEDIGGMPLVRVLLEHAIGDRGRPDFEAALRVAANADIRWSDDQLSLSVGSTSTSTALPRREELMKTLMIKLPPAPLRETPVATNQPEDHTSSAISADQIRNAFSHLSQLTGADRREGQVEYAQFIAEAMQQGGRFAIESGTGTGKTRGYLVPACEFITRAPRQKVVIATSTKNLQRQIILNELPHVTPRGSLYQNIKGAVLKGKSNYICLSALGDIYEGLFLNSRNEDHVKDKERLTWLHLAILCLRADGDIEAENISTTYKSEFLNLRGEVNAGISCRSGICDNGIECLYPRIENRAAEAQIIVTNHHKLATLRQSLTDRASKLIIDEGDQFPDNFKSACKNDLSGGEIALDLVRRLVGFRGKRGLTQILREHAQNQLEKGMMDSELYNKIKKLTDQLEDACQEISTSTNGIRAVASRVRHQEVRWQRLNQTHALESLMESLSNLVRKLEAVVESLRSLSEIASELGKVNKFWESRNRQILRYQGLAEGQKKSAHAISQDYDTYDFVHTVSYENNNWRLRKTPMNIGPILEATLYKQITTVGYTSATLYVDGTLGFFRRELGEHEAFCSERRIPSPFNYEKNVLGAVATTLPVFNFGNNNRNNWYDSIAQAVIQLVVPIYGRSLILFTSYNDLKQIKHRITRDLEKNDIDVLVQDGTSEVQISQFHAVEQSVLLGVDRFWTGVDFPGRTLSQIIVVRVPNPNFSDPVIEHRREYMRYRFWDEYYHPVTRLKLRQGFGRLIRKDTDKGVFVILDPRIMQPGWRHHRELPIDLTGDPTIGDPNAELAEISDRGLSLLHLRPEYNERYAMEVDDASLSQANY